MKRTIQGLIIKTLALLIAQSTIAAARSVDPSDQIAKRVNSTPAKNRFGLSHLTDSLSFSTNRSRNTFEVGAVEKQLLKQANLENKIKLQKTSAYSVSRNSQQKSQTQAPLKLYRTARASR